MSDNPFKAQAQRLADYLSRVHGVKLKHASMLEAIAQAHGRADWNTLLACGSLDFASTTVQVAPAAAQVPLLTRLLEAALIDGAEGLSLDAHEQGINVFVRKNETNRQVLKGTLEDYAQIIQSLRALLDTTLSEDLLGEFAQCGLQYASSYAGPLEGRAILMPGRTETQHHVMLRWRHPKLDALELGSLGLSCIAEWRRILAYGTGVAVVGGLTGSGRTTTVIASARELVRQGRSVHIVDRDIRQNDVPGASYSLPSQKRGAVIVVDLRSPEEVRAAFDMAYQGAFVLATLHTSTLLNTLMRLTDSGVSKDYQRALLRGMLVQRLMPRACKACQGMGCPCCYQGVVGRRPVVECVSPRLDATIDQRLFGEGCDVIPMVEDAVEYCRLGVITPENLAKGFGEQATARLRNRRH